MESKISVGSLAAAMAQSCGKSKKSCEDFLREFFHLISDTLHEGEIVKIKGFGTFKLSEVESRTSVNVNNGEPHEISSHLKVVFTPSKELATAINAPFSEFESVEIDEDEPDDIFYEREDEDLDEEIEGIEEEERLSDEDKVSNYRLEEGSDEEGEDDEITTIAYSTEPEPASPIEVETTDSESESLNVESKEETQEEEPEPIVSREVMLPVYYERPEKTRFGIGFLTGALSAFVVYVVIFMLGCFFDWWPVNFGNIKEPLEEEIIAANPVEEIEPQIEEPEEEIIPVYDTVSTTRYLTTIAREHYGNFNFWPYIYIENQSILGHPDRITPGTQVVVPDLSKYGVDPTNKEDIAEAKRKAAEIYSRYR